MEIEGKAFTPIPGRDGWFWADQGEAYRREDLTAFARRANRSQETHLCLIGYLEDSGQSHSLFLVPTRDPFEVMTWFGFPTHELESLRPIHAKNPLLPTFADPRGFHCDFLDEVTGELATELDTAVTTALSFPMIDDGDDVGDFALENERLEFFDGW